MERVNNNLRMKVDENSSLEVKVRGLTQDNEELRRRLNDLGEANRKIAEYENRIALLTQEIERLNGNIRQLENNNRNLVQEVESLRRKTSEYEITIVQEWQTKVRKLESDNEDLRRRLTELGEVNRKLSEYENRLTLLGQ